MKQLQQGKIKPQQNKRRVTGAVEVELGPVGYRLKIGGNGTTNPESYSTQYSVITYMRKESEK